MLRSTQKKPNGDRSIFGLSPHFAEPVDKRGYTNDIKTGDVHGALKHVFEANGATPDALKLSLAYPVEMAIILVGVPIPPEFHESLENNALKSYLAINPDKDEATKGFNNDFI